MSNSNKKTDSQDNSVPRFRAEKRQTQTSARNPDRRAGRDRRKGYDRRSGLGRRRHQVDGAVERKNVFRDKNSNE